MFSTIALTKTISNFPSRLEKGSRAESPRHLPPLGSTSVSLAPEHRAAPVPPSPRLWTSLEATQSTCEEPGQSAAHASPLRGLSPAAQPAGEQLTSVCRGAACREPHDPQPPPADRPREQPGRHPPAPAGLGAAAGLCPPARRLPVLAAAPPTRPPALGETTPKLCQEALQPRRPSRPYIASAAPVAGETHPPGGPGNSGGGGLRGAMPLPGSA